jgi:UDP-N-acetylmuramate dehydrogenase
MVIKMTELIEELKKLNIGKIITDVSLKNYTTYKIGGTARVMAFPKNTESLVKSLEDKIYGLRKWF